MKIKRKFMAGFLALLLLSSQLVLPCSALANNSQPTNQPITKSKDEPKKNTKEKSDNNPFKIEPLKELKSQDRSSSPEKKYKHVKMNGLPKGVSFLTEPSQEGEGCRITLAGLKPNSQCTFRFKVYTQFNQEDSHTLNMTADNNGTVNEYIYFYSRTGKVMFFEGDIEDNSPDIGNDPKSEFNFSDTQNIDPRDDVKFTIKLNNVTGDTVKLKIKFTINGDTVYKIKEYTVHPDKSGEAIIHDTYQTPKHFTKSLTITYGLGNDDPIKPVILTNSQFFGLRANGNTYEAPPVTMHPEFLNNGLYHFCVAVYLDGNQLDGVPIELLDYKNDIVASAKTQNGFGEATFNIPLTLGKHDLKVRMNKEFLSSYEKAEHKNIYWDKEKNITLTVEMCPLDDGRKEPAVTRIDMYGEDDDFDNSNSLLAFRNFTKTIKPEQKEYTITVQSIATKEGQPDKSLYNIPIEIYRNDGTLIVSTSTNAKSYCDHYCTKDIKVKAFPGEKLKVKQIVNKAPSDLNVELDPNEKIITADDSLDKTVVFTNKDLMDLNDCYIKFNFQFPPNSNISFDEYNFLFSYMIPDELSPIFAEINTHNSTLILEDEQRIPIKRPLISDFCFVGLSILGQKLPPGYYVESINGMDPNTTFEKAPKEVTIKIGYKATGEFDYEVGKIAIPNEKYSGYFETGLLDEQGHIVISAVNDEKGNFHFNKIKYTEKDVGKHKYKRYIKYTNKGLKLVNTIGEIRRSDDKSGYPFVDVTVKDNGDGTLSVSPINTTNYFDDPFLAPLLPVTGTIKTILAVGVLVLGTTTAIIIKRRKNTKSNRKIGN